MKLTKLFNDFFNSEKAGGLILVLATILSLCIANSPWQTAYTNCWQFSFAGHSVVHWINDGLMTIFFLLIGLELEREIYTGELSSFKNASLPVIAAVGGMIVPALIFLLFNTGGPGQPGAGIPMATDIAFAVGILSLLGSRVPASLKIFLTALAVIDDLGAIIVIAVFYTSTLSLVHLFLALGVFAVLLVLNRLKIQNPVPYLLGGIVMWYFMLQSGVHATLAGILLAFAIPFGNGDERSVSYRIQHFLHKPVAFFILPLFAMANTGISISSDWYAGLTQNLSVGIIAGLLTGKPLGIALFAYIGTAVKFCTLPSELKWKHIIGAGFLGGIGFTMSVFITLLAFTDAVITDTAKIAILIASCAAGIIGYLFLHFTLKKTTPGDTI
ncbi:Na+/H+ antiporter NhaA [Ferruginibacter sp.]